MDKITEKEAFEKLVDFTVSCDDNEYCYLHVYIDGYANLFALKKDFSSDISSQFQITDMSVIELERFSKAYPGYDHYHAVVEYNPEHDLFSVIHETIDNAGARLNKMQSEQVFFDRNLNRLRSGYRVE